MGEKNHHLNIGNMTFLDDTIVAPATVPGTGAISLIRISGPDALRVADSIICFKHGNAASARPNTVKFGTITAADGSLLDEVLCCIYRAPHSYTGEDSVEIMCHASAYITGEIITLAIGQGCRNALPGEYTRRAYLSGKMDLAQAEAVADVISAGTAASHRIAMNQLKGGISTELAALRAQLLEMTALMELELDFSEEDVEFADRDRLMKLLEAAITRIGSLAQSFHLGNAIKNGVPVAIVGPANAGKSTLLNSILGEQRAIVSDIAGTTRDTIEETFNVEGVLFRFVDTAGIRETEGEIERIGIQRSIESIRKSDIVIIVLDATTLSDDTSVEQSLEQILQVIDNEHQHVVFAVNKIDLCGEFGSEKAMNIFVKVKNIIVHSLELHGFNTCSNIIVPISAKNSDGIKALLQVVHSQHVSNAVLLDESSILVSNLRHYEALVTANKHLLTVQKSLLQAVPSDLVAEDLREAIRSLGTITGEIGTEEVLGEIFGKFCIGK